MTSSSQKETESLMIPHSKSVWGMSEKVSGNGAQHGKQCIPKKQATGEVRRGPQVPRTGRALRLMISGVHGVAADCHTQHEFYG